jgi:aspartate aminotransferase
MTETLETSPFAERLRLVSSSRTQQVTAEVHRLRREGIDIVDLGVGEPETPTPDHVKRAAVDALTADFTRYTLGAGVVSLREAIGRHYADRYGVHYDVDQIVVTSGGKQALFNVAMALFGPGDEVITHVPGWPSIPEQVKLAGATSVPVRTWPEDGFGLRADVLLDAVTPRTRGVIINSPANPTGATIAEEELERLADGLAGRDVWLVVDLCYEQLIYEAAPHNLPRVLERRLDAKTVLVGSASKSYSMTGWRCGWSLSSRKVATACNAIQSHSTSHATSISQRAAEAALTGPQDCVEAMRREYRNRRDTLCRLIQDDGRLRVVKPAGAFYLFPDVTDVLDGDRRRTSADLALALLREAHVAAIPGEAFDAPGHLRLSYAVSLPELEEGWGRIQRYLG